MCIAQTQTCIGAKITEDERKGALANLGLQTKCTEEPGVALLEGRIGLPRRPICGKVNERASGVRRL